MKLGVTKLHHGMATLQRDVVLRRESSGSTSLYHLEVVR